MTGIETETPYAPLALAGQHPRVLFSRQIAPLGDPPCEGDCEAERHRAAAQAVRAALGEAGDIVLDAECSPCHGYPPADSAAEGPVGAHAAGHARKWLAAPPPLGLLDDLYAARREYEDMLAARQARVRAAIEDGAIPAFAYGGGAGAGE